MNFFAGPKVAMARYDFILKYGHGRLSAVSQCRNREVLSGETERHRNGDSQDFYLETEIFSKLNNLWLVLRFLKISSGPVFKLNKFCSGPIFFHEAQQKFLGIAVPIVNLSLKHLVP